MTFKLPDLPYDASALEPHIDARTMGIHHGKHHQAYVTNVNKLYDGDKSLEELVKTSEGGLFNNAAQVWNHTFYWNCLAPGGAGNPTGDLAEAIQKQFGSIDQFRQQFNQSAMSLFGSGWTWLVRRPDGTLAIENGANAKTPIVDGATVPLLACDVWEHAYYLDYQNERNTYTDTFLDKLINWEFAAANLQ